MPFNSKWMEDPFSRIMDQVLVGDDCWQWTGRKLVSGYGSATVNNEDWRVHRYVYTKMVGPIPDGLVIDHLCFNKLCVKPDHLDAVTQGENVRRSAARQTECKQGHPFDEKNTYIDPKGKRGCRACRRIGMKRVRDRRAVSTP